MPSCRGAFLIVLLLSWRGSAEGPLRLAVLEFEVQRDLQLDRRTFSIRLQNTARRTVPHLFVMTQANLETLVGAAGMSLEQCEGQCAVETGRLIGADLVIAGRISRVGRKLSLSMQMYETGTGGLVGGEDVAARGEDGLLAAADLAAARLLAPLAKRPAPRAGADGAQERPIAEEAHLPQVSLVECLIAFETEPPGATVLLDGRLLCQATPCTRLLAPGAHDLSLQKEGFEEAAEALIVAGKAAVHRRLQRVAATVRVETEPEGLPVSVDGRRLFSDSLARIELTPGPHDLVIDDPCWRRDGQQVVVQTGEERIVHLVAQSRQAGLRIVAEDRGGNAVEARATLDGAVLGDVPGAFTVPVCAKRIGVEGAGGSASQELRLIEGKVTELVVKLPVPALTGGGSVDFVPLTGGEMKGGSFKGQRVAPFAIARTPTTVAQYGMCVDQGACSRPGTRYSDCNWDTARREHPINCVDWSQARAFCQWIGARLPTATEREWAASSGEDWIYPWGDQEPAGRACWDGEGSDAGKASRLESCAVASHREGNSKQGVSDLAGNVWEWLEGDFGIGKEVRGGSWSQVASEGLRAAFRDSRQPELRSYGVGFRCAR